jgi:hypothetical protein
VQRTQQEEEVRDYKRAGTVYYKASSTQEGSKASTALGKEGIDGIEGVSSAGARARGRSSSSLAEQGKASLVLRIGTTTGPGPRY